MARTKPTHQPLAAPSTTTPKQPPPAPPPPPREVLPVAHYLPRVPLQLFAVCFTLIAASTPQGKLVPAPTRVVQQLALQPLATLPLVCAALALVQTWFGYWVRSCRLDALARAKATPEPTGTDAAPPPAKSARSSGFRGSLGTMWDAALKGQAPTQALWNKRTHAKRTSAGFDTSFVPEAVVVTLLGAFALHACAVLLGAPLTSNTPSTFLLSLLVSILALLPLAIALPPSGTAERFAWLRLWSTLSPADDLELALVLPALGTLLGAWLGAVPIPLDWDRPWQRYPTTPVLGALAGHALASLATLAQVAYGGVVRAAVDVLEEAGRGEEAGKGAGKGEGDGVKAGKGRGKKGKGGKAQ